jgi:uncharacterized protein
MENYNKPLPKSSPWSQFFWDNTKKRKLMIQQCEDCGKFIFYPKLVCPFCLSSNLRWVESSGKGKIYSFTIVNKYPPTGFSVPYVVAIVDLEEGVKLCTNIVNYKTEKLRCDMDVEVVFEDVTNEITLPKFQPAS